MMMKAMPKKNPVWKMHSVRRGSDFRPNVSGGMLSQGLVRRSSAVAGDSWFPGSSNLFDSMLIVFSSLSLNSLRLAIRTNAVEGSLHNFVAILPQFAGRRCGPQ